VLGKATEIAPKENTIDELNSEKFVKIKYQNKGRSAVSEGRAILCYSFAERRR
jgi:hypothetical protein